jgi:hypothetical protein
MPSISAVSRADLERDGSGVQRLPACPSWSVYDLARLRPVDRRVTSRTESSLLPDYEASVGTFIKMLQGHWGH